MPSTLEDALRESEPAASFSAITHIIIKDAAAGLPVGVYKYEYEKRTAFPVDYEESFHFDSVKILGGISSNTLDCFTYKGEIE